MTTPGFNEMNYRVLHARKFIEKTPGRDKNPFRSSGSELLRGTRKDF